VIEDRYGIWPIGCVELSLKDIRTAPRQGDEDAPPAVIRLRPEVLDAARDVSVGDELLVPTWLHLADRGTLAVRPP
jgi:tRNA (Thr-GGU) A37 N-methylase